MNTEMVIASGETGIRVLMELCQRVLDGKVMPDEWKTSVVVPIFKGKGDVMNCEAYRGVKLLEYSMKIVESVLERRIRALIKLDEMQLDLCLGKGQQMLYLYCNVYKRNIKIRESFFCDLWIYIEKPFDRVPRKVIE